MRRLALALLLVGCKFDPLPQLGGGGDGGPTGDGGIDACSGIGCNIETCSAGEETTITGTVFMPNGTTPLANVDVYVPNSDPGPMPMGCVRCGPLPGDPIRHVRTGADGSFRLVDVPAGADIPLVITIGKWRRQIVIPQVNECEITDLPRAETRLPKNRTEGDMPRLALVTGQADALECVVRRIGIDDAEFGVIGGSEPVHMFAGPGAANRLLSGTMFPTPQTLWGSLPTLAPYDAVLLSCDGNTNPGSKTQAMMDAMKAYADGGGRIFAMHFHSIWIGGEIDNPNHAPAVWRDLALFDTGTLMPSALSITTTTPQGQRFADWQEAVVPGSMGRVSFVGGSGRSTVSSVRDTTNVLEYAKVATASPAGGRTQLFSFDTPVESPEANRCGRVMFSDMHQGAFVESRQAVPFPSGCGSQPLTPQDHALTYMLFELQSCVGAPP